MTTPPGWYPNPADRTTQRYWDGENWTDQIAPLQQETMTQLPAVKPPIARTTVLAVAAIGAIVIVLMVILVASGVFATVTNTPAPQKRPDAKSEQARQTLTLAYKAAQAALDENDGFQSPIMMQRAIEEAEPSLAPVAVAADARPQSVLAAQQVTVQRASKTRLVLGWKTSDGVVWQLLAKGPDNIAFSSSQPGQEGDSDEDIEATEHPVLPD